MELVLLLLFLLITKHYVCDFVLQSFPWMYLNKGTYGHPGGIVHALIHLVGTLGVILPVLGGTTVVLWVAFVEFVAHYNIDWAKVKYCTYRKWGPLNSSEYWWILGFDQYLHGICYLAMVWYWVK